MLSITPCRTLISDRFPVASFVVKVPDLRCFEVAYATDPELFLPANRSRRRPENFFSTRGDGLLQAPSGETTILLPPEQLRRFRGAERIYYAAASYGRPSGTDPQFTVAPHTLGETPFVHLSKGFSGRGLDRSRLTMGSGAGERAYGSGASLTWGGDLATAPPSVHRPTTGYDDGFEPELWNSPTTYGGRATPPSYGYVFDPKDIVRSSGLAHPDDYDGPAPTEQAPEPPGLAEPPRDASPSFAPPAYGGVSARTTGEPLSGFEDPSELWAQRYGNPAGTTAHRPDTPPPPAPAKAKTPIAKALPAILRPVVRAHTANAYSHVSTSPEGHVRWGIGRFSAHDGSLRDVLASAHRRDSAWTGDQTPLFDQVFGTRRAHALRDWLSASEPGQTVDGERLTAPSWIESLRRAGSLHLPPPEGLDLPGQQDPFKAAQNEVLVESVLRRFGALATRLGLDTVQGLAVLLDVAIELGESTRDFLEEAARTRPPATALVDHLSGRTHPEHAARLRAILDATRDGADQYVEIAP